MTIQEYQQSLQRTVKGIAAEVNEKILFTSANRLLANIKNRIQREGKDSSDKKLSPYSTKPFYATKSQFVRKSSFKAIGKNGFKGERLVKTGKREYKVVKSKPKTMFLKQGYKELRQVQGMSVNEKNLTYSGETMRSYTIGISSNAIVLGLDSKDASNIRVWQEAKNKGKIFTATKKELDAYKKDVSSQYQEAFKKMIYGR